jgi:predicted metal-dependent phosphoesterase TrpH
MYFYETHLHTLEGSACGEVAAADYIDYMIVKGFTGMAVTDHFFNGNCAVDKNLRWEEKCERYCEGYKDAKRVGEQIGLSVFFGMEYSYFGTDLLVYGLDEAWLKANPQIMQMGVKEFMGFVYENGGLIVHAHPFREAGYIDTIRLYPYDVDAVEVFNAGNRDPKFDQRADLYAESYGLVKVAGSDRHDTVLGGRCATVFAQKLQSIDDYMRLVRLGKIERLICER